MQLQETGRDETPACPALPSLPALLAKLTGFSHTGIKTKGKKDYRSGLEAEPSGSSGVPQVRFVLWRLLPASEVSEEEAITSPHSPGQTNKNINTF